MNLLSAPMQARIPIGTVVIAGKQFEVTINVEWARFFESLALSTNTNTATLSGNSSIDGVALMLGGDGGDQVEFIPGPPGKQGPQGEPGPALFMLQDTDTNDIFWPIPG